MLETVWAFAWQNKLGYCWLSFYFIDFYYLDNTMKFFFNDILQEICKIKMRVWENKLESRDKLEQHGFEFFFILFANF
jgi:hypothetical protein